VALDGTAGCGTPRTAPMTRSCATSCCRACAAVGCLGRCAPPATGPDPDADDQRTASPTRPRRWTPARTTSFQSRSRRCGAVVTPSPRSPSPSSDLALGGQPATAPTTPIPDRSLQTRPAVIGQPEREGPPSTSSLRDRYFVKESDVIVRLPPASIANTSKPCSPVSRDATNSGGTVTLIGEGGSVAGRVTSKDPAITW